MKGGYIMADMPSFCVKNKDGGIDFKFPGYKNSLLLLVGC